MTNVTQPDLEPFLELVDAVSNWLAGRSPYDGNTPGHAKSGAPQYLAQVGMVPPAVAVGWKQREQVLNQGQGQANRIVFIPGAAPDGSSQGGADQGAIIQPVRRKGIGDRVLATFRRTITVSLWAADNMKPGNLDDERLQIAAVGRLRSLVIAALSTVAMGDFKREGPVRKATPFSANRGFGIEELYQFSHDEEQLDLPVNIRTNVTPTVDRSPPS
jgi:hypothetical protein